MSTAAITVQGIVQPDGTLELDPNVKLPVGRVQVTIQPLPEAQGGTDDWWQSLQRARAVLEARGTGFRTEERIEAERADFRSGDERLEDLDQAIDDERRRSERKEC
jgi:hypothetical protein